MNAQGEDVVAGIRTPQPIQKANRTLKGRQKNLSLERVKKNVAEDAKAREEMVNASHQLGVPVIDVNGQIIVGFDKKTLVDLLGVK